MADGWAGEGDPRIDHSGSPIINDMSCFNDNDNNNNNFYYTTTNKTVF